MINTLSIPDETHKVYTKYNPVNPAKAMVAQLERFKDFSPVERALIIPVKERQEIEALHQRPFDRPEELVEWVRQLTSASIDGVEVQLSELQRKRIRTRAESRGIDPNKYLVDQVKRALRAHFGG